VHGAAASHSNQTRSALVAASSQDAVIGALAGGSAANHGGGTRDQKDLEREELGQRAQAYSESAVGRIVEDLVSDAGDPASAAASQELFPGRTSPLQQSYVGRETEAAESQSRALPDPYFRSQYADSMVEKLMDTVVTGVEQEVAESARHFGDPREAAVQFYKGSVEVDGRRMAVRVVKRLETGTLDIELFDAMKDEMLVVSASVRDWGASGYESLAGLVREDKQRLVRWLVHEKLHRLKERPNKVIYRGMLSFSGTNCMVTAVVSGEQTTDAGVLTLQMFVPATGFTSKIDVAEEEWVGAGYPALDAASEDDIVALVRWLCERRGFASVDEQAEEIVIFRGGVAVSGVPMMLQANLQVAASHPVQLVFLNPATCRRHELQLNRPAWARLQQGHEDPGAVVQALCREHLSWDKDGDLFLKQVTWVIGAEAEASAEARASEAAAVAAAQEPEVPERPKTPVARVSLRVGRQLCCMTIHPKRGGISVQLRLQFLRSGRTHVLGISRDKWDSLGLGEVWRAPQEDRRSAAETLATMILVRPDGSLEIAEAGSPPQLPRLDQQPLNENGSVRSVETGDRSLATTDSAVLSLVSWESASAAGADPHSAQPPSPTRRRATVRRSVAAPAGGKLVDVELVRHERVVDVALTFSENQQQCLVHVEPSWWSRLGLDDVWTGAPAVQDSMCRELLSMLTIDSEDGTASFNEFKTFLDQHAVEGEGKQADEAQAAASAEQPEDGDTEGLGDSVGERDGAKTAAVAADLHVVMSEWRGSYLRGQLTDGSVLLVKYNLTHPKGVQIHALRLDESCPHPIAATLDFAKNSRGPYLLNLSHWQAAYFGLEGASDLEVQEQVPLLVQMTQQLSVDVENLKLHVYRQEPARSPTALERRRNQI